MVQVARCLFSIPGSQAEIKRIFSVAGILSKHRRRCISVDRLDEMANIYVNISGRSLLEDLPVRADCNRDHLDALADFESSADDRVPSDAFLDFYEL